MYMYSVIYIYREREKETVRAKYYTREIAGWKSVGERLLRICWHLPVRNIPLGKWQSIFIYLLIS